MKTQHNQQDVRINTKNTAKSSSVSPHLAKKKKEVRRTQKIKEQEETQSSKENELSSVNLMLAKKKKETIRTQQKQQKVRKYRKNAAKSDLKCITVVM